MLRNSAFDLVAPDPEDGKCLLVAEVKWRKLRAPERRQVLTQLESKWQRSVLNQKHLKVRFEIFDAAAMREL